MRLDPLNAYLIGFLGGVCMTAGLILSVQVSPWFLPLMFLGPATTKWARWLDTRWLRSSS